MKSFFSKCVVAFALLSCTFLSLSAYAQKEEKKGKKAPDPTAGVAKKLEAVELTAEQKTKIDAIKAEHGPKLTAAQEKVSKALTPEQVKARREAMAAAKAAGKKGKEAAEDVKAALKLTPEQEKGFADAEKELRDCTAAFTKAVVDVLTDEQKEKAKLGGKKKPK
jgi:hypothetical protein